MPACLVEEQRAVAKLDAVSQHNRLSLSTGHFNFVSVVYIINRMRLFTVRDLSCCIAHLV